MTWYSPGLTSWLEPAQPGADVLRFQDTRRITVGLLPVSRTMLDPLLPAQSAELQMRWPAAATTTATDVLLTLNWQACPLVAARTVKRGVVPVWYQYCGDEMLSVTAPRAHASARPVEWGGAGLRCRARDGRGVGEAAGRRR